MPVLATNVATPPTAAPFRNLRRSTTLLSDFFMGRVSSQEPLYRPSALGAHKSWNDRLYRRLPKTGGYYSLKWSAHSIHSLVAGRGHRRMVHAGGEYRHALKRQALLGVRMLEDFADLIGGGTLGGNAPNASDQWRGTRRARHTRRNWLPQPSIYSPPSTCRQNRWPPPRDNPRTAGNRA